LKGQWAESKDVAPKLKGGESYRLYSEIAPLGESKGSSVEREDPGDTEMIKFREPKSYSIAVGGSWNGIPRKIETLSGQSAVYKKIVSDILKEKGLGNVPVQIKQIYRTDLDGDGTDEVLISATNLDFENVEPSQKAGTYSVVFLRRVVAGAVKTEVLTGEFYTTNSTDEAMEISYVSKIAAVVDANGDGKMEVVVESKYYEGFGFSVQELKNDGLHEVLNNGLGA